MRTGSVQPHRELKSPEMRTLMERLASWRHLPYTWVSLLLALVLTSPGRMLACFLDTMSLRSAIEKTLAPSSSNPMWHAIIGQALVTAVAFYILLVIRYMRVRIVETEKELASLLPHGKRDSFKAFRPVGLWYGPIPVAAFLVLLFMEHFQTDFHSAGGPVDFILLLVSTAFNMLLYATLIWVYFTSLYGIRRIGKLRLRLRPYYVDELLGLRPAGALSLSLTMSYFGAVILLTLIHIFNPNFGPVEFSATLIALAVFGVLMFFFPLFSIHRQMVEVKQRERASLRSQIALLMGPSEESRNPGKREKDTLRDIRTILFDVKGILASSVFESRVAGLPTWPVDLTILERLVTILLAVTAGIIVRIITVKVVP